nr:hypothetical protein [Tanacetum cinerariifolium]
MGRSGRVYWHYSGGLRGAGSATDFLLPRVFKNSSSSSYSGTRRQKRRKLSPTSRTMGQRMPILLAEETLGDEEEEYPFVNKHPSFKEEPIMLVEEQLCPVYDTDNEEKEDGDEEEVVNADYEEALVFDDDQYEALVFDDDQYEALVFYDDDQYKAATATVQILTSVDFYGT